MEAAINCNKCEHDEFCCKVFGVTLNKEEASNFKYKKIVPLTENNIILGYVYVLNKEENGSCIYFNDEALLCEIYEKSPEACKKFSCIGRL